VDLWAVIAGGPIAPSSICCARGTPAISVRQLGSTELGQNRTGSPDLPDPMSAHPPEVDVGGLGCHVGLGPQADLVPAATGRK
jgi:hypothetical protein